MFSATDGSHRDRDGSNVVSHPRGIHPHPLDASRRPQTPNSSSSTVVKLQLNRRFRVRSPSTTTTSHGQTATSTTDQRGSDVTYTQRHHTRPSFRRHGPPVDRQLLQQRRPREAPSKLFVDDQLQLRIHDLLHTPASSIECSSYSHTWRVDLYPHFTSDGAGSTASTSNKQVQSSNKIL